MDKRSGTCTSAGKKLTIVQSNYVPWKGYFDLINMADEFILHDDAKYTKGDWRNRNRIVTPNGVRWLTIPVSRDHVEPFRRICETRVADRRWARKHWAIIVGNYCDAPYFERYEEICEHAYREAAEYEYLSRVNHHFIAVVCSILGIKTKISWSMEFPRVEGRNERLVEMCQAVGASEYISGPAAKAYIDESLFTAAGIRLTYMNYEGYPEYPQLYGGFEHAVSILDVLFNTGPDAPDYLKSFAKVGVVSAPGT